MSAASSTSVKALRHLAYSSKSFQVPHVQVRGLTMTGPTTYASPVLSKKPMKVAQKAANRKLEEVSRIQLLSRPSEAPMPMRACISPSTPTDIMPRIALADRRQRPRQSRLPPDQHVPLAQDAPRHLDH